MGRVLAVGLWLWLSACSAAPQPAHGVIVARDPRDLPAPIRNRAAGRVEVELTTREVVAEVAPGQRAWIWSFNGTVPGPLIRAREGDEVVIRLTNEGGSVEPHSIDLHAVLGSAGGHALTEVDPGETAELTFIATRQGAYFYHCGAEDMPWEHVAYGMYGAILVEPPGGLPPVDAEFYVAESEWYFGSDGGEAAEHGGGPGPGVLTLDEDAAEREDPTLFTFNGHRAALVSAELYGEAMRVPVGGRARIVFVGAGPNLAASPHVIGGIFDTVAFGHFEDVLRNEETVLVPAGSAVVLELSLPVAGAYPLVDHALFRASRGAMGIIHAGP